MPPVQVSPDKNVMFRCTSASFTNSLDWKRLRHVMRARLTESTRKLLRLTKRLWLDEWTGLAAHPPMALSPEIHLFLEPARAFGPAEGNTGLRVVAN